MYMYVNKRVELAQRGIALQKIYVLFIIIICFTLKLIRAKKGITRTYVTHSSLNRWAQCMAACRAV